MPFKFIDDGYPEADDYSSNYEWVAEPVRARGVKRDADKVDPKAELAKKRAMLQQRLRLALNGLPVPPMAGA